MGDLCGVCEKPLCQNTSFGMGSGCSDLLTGSLRAPTPHADSITTDFFEKSQKIPRFCLSRATRVWVGAFIGKSHNTYIDIEPYRDTFSRSDSASRERERERVSTSAPHYFESLKFNKSAALATRCRAESRSSHATNRSSLANAKAACDLCTVSVYAYSRRNSLSKVSKLALLLFPRF